MNRQVTHTIAALFVCSLTSSVRADHDRRAPILPGPNSQRAIQDEYRERLKSLDCWYDDARDELRCGYDRERRQLERQLRDARRLCEPERGYQMDALRHALDDLHCTYRDARKSLHEQYDCRRDAIRKWYQLALRCSDPPRHGPPHRPSGSPGPAPRFQIRLGWGGPTWTF